ncbi:EAL domain-containing protein [Planococcus sp. CPCC 101016]|uniref:bifunctional diguanylate cyclase/phosphodiesterase n=1 Tax=Planococcus sp. CPCC 101016 TaxID=2599617 RepID=UPI0011B3BB9B|nr:bifunctional diguanylate cyclase/phosphodiesterase [Planococcus sp. CPCC 101016]TWT07076.1 EAL domain-containing protein [Planococcus sp. CPCC 101016]
MGKVENVDVEDKSLLNNEEFQEEEISYKQMFEVMVQNASVSMYVLKGDGFSYVNRHFRELSGYTEEELISGKVTIKELIHPEDLPVVEQNIQKRMANKEATSRYQVRMYKKDGELIYIEIQSTNFMVEGKMILYGTVFDVTAEVTSSLLLKESEERSRSLFHNNPDAIFSFDLDGNFLDANPGCEQLTGFQKQELVNMSFAPIIAPIIAPEDLEIAIEYFGKATTGISNSHEISIIRKDGQRRNIEITKFAMNSGGEIKGVYGIAKDITEKIEHRKLMEELVFYDSLTKLPNRKLFEDRLAQVLRRSIEQENRPTVLFLDLDRFKFINDSLGHHMGDEFLKIVSNRLKENIRFSDTVGRFAGDEFAILLPSATEEEAVLLAKRLNTVLAQPFDVMGHSIAVSASIGIAFSSGKGESIDHLIRKADTAMYYTKKLGKNNYTVYTEELDQKTVYKLTIEKDLKEAITNNELFLHYQPINDLKTNEINGMEALIRWNHPVLGVVPPDHFIPISEESGQIVPIGKWVLQKACSQNKAWQEQGIPPFKICVNISTIQLQHPNFVDAVKEVLEDTGLAAEWLELEVTESILLEDTVTLQESLCNLKKLGVSISIDDFGTGYTSLSYLRQFSFDRVKIDRSFINDISKDYNRKAITSTIISLAHKLNMSVVAEGIEDDTQLAFLKSENCDSGQGYYFSRPLPAEMHQLVRGARKV